MKTPPWWMWKDCSCYVPFSTLHSPSEVIPTIETTYKIPGAPHLALLTDFHNGEREAVLSSLQLHAPSLICICGDVIVGHRPEEDRSPLETQENVLPFLSGCAAFAPTYLSLGNHELFLDHTDLEKIASTGVVVLDNSWIELDGLVIGGLTSGYVTDYRHFRATLPAEPRYPHREDISGIGGAVNSSQHKPELDWLNQFCSVPGLHLLLSHHPEYWPLLKDKNINLILSGHAHGGQWRVFNHGVWSPGQGLWPRWTRGVYDGRLVVSAGLNNTTWIPRIGNPTEVVYLESP